MAPSVLLRRHRSPDGAVIRLRPLTGTFPPPFSWKSQSEGLQQTAPPTPQGTSQHSAPGHRGPVSGKGALFLPSSSMSAHSTSSIPFPPPPPPGEPTSAPRAAGNGNPSSPSPAPGAAHSRTSDSAWRIPMERGSRPPRAPTAPVFPSLFSEEGGPCSASNPRAASSPRRPLPRRPRTSAYRGWLPHRRPRSQSGCLAWWRRRAGPGMAAPPCPRPSARLLRSLAR